MTETHSIEWTIVYVAIPVLYNPTSLLILPRNTRSKRRMTGQPVEKVYKRDLIGQPPIPLRNNHLNEQPFSVIRNGFVTILDESMV